MTHPSGRLPEVLESILTTDREAVMSFISISSRKTANADAVMDAFCLSLSLKYALGHRAT